jgi:hypothetical protein
MCQAPVNHCDPNQPGSSTAACIAQQDKTTTTDPTLVCSTCVANNNCFLPTFQGGTCEGTAGNANFFGSAADAATNVLPDGKTCAQVFAPLTVPVSETKVCLGVLNNIFTSKCAAGLQETPCVCGATDVTACTNGTATPTGAVYDMYACDFASTSTAVINDVKANFVVQTFGAGQANALIQCAAANGCDCF